LSNTAHGMITHLCNVILATSTEQRTEVAATTTFWQMNYLTLAMQWHCDSKTDQARVWSKENDIDYNTEYTR